MLMPSSQCVVFVPMVAYEEVLESTRKAKNTDDRLKTTNVLGLVLSSGMQKQFCTFWLIANKFLFA
jgi:hypothetical protein